MFSLWLWSKPQHCLLWRALFLWKQLLNVVRDGVRINTIGVQNFATTHLLAKNIYIFKRKKKVLFLSLTVKKNYLAQIFLCSWINYKKQTLISLQIKFHMLMTINIRRLFSQLRHKPQNLYWENVDELFWGQEDYFRIIFQKPSTGAPKVV